jgi:hypothetical protein
MICANKTFDAGIVYVETRYFASFFIRRREVSASLLY